MLLWNVYLCVFFYFTAFMILYSSYIGLWTLLSELKVYVCMYVCIAQIPQIAAFYMYVRNLETFSAEILYGDPV